MSLTQDITHISVTGSKENVTRMLNAAILNIGTKKTIVEGDDIETINLKIKEEHGRYGLRVSLLDLFDEICLQDDKLQEKINKEEVRDKEVKEGWFAEEITLACVRMFDLLRVQEAENSYTVDIEIYECEVGYYGGWDYIENIARLYQCRIVADDELFRNGCSLGLNQTSIWEPEGDEVKETIIRPDDINNWDDIEKAFAPLMQMDPQRYSSYKIRAYEILIYNLEFEAKQAKAMMEWHQAMEEEGIELPTLYKDIVFSELSGPESIEEKHKLCLTYNNNEEILSTIYKLRAKRLQDVDKELADLYNQFLAHLHTDIEEEQERQRKIDEERAKADYDLPF